MNSAMKYVEQNRTVTRAIQKIAGAGLWTMRQLPAFRSQLRAMDLTGKYLVVGILRAMKQDGRPVETELELEAVIDQTQIRRMIAESLFSTETDYGRKLSYGDLMKILGGSDIPDVAADFGARERLKIDTASQTREVQWIALLPSYTHLAEMINELAEVESMDGIKVKEHKPRNGGGALEFVLNVAPDQVMNEDWREFFSKMWPYLVHLGVPGVRETMTWFVYKHQMNFDGFDPAKYVVEWDQWRQEKYKDQFGSRGKSCLEKREKETDPICFQKNAVEHLLDDWQSPPHCGIATLESAVGLQKTETAKERLKAVIQELCVNRNFMINEKVSVAVLCNKFKNHAWPFVLLCREWNQDQWKKRLFPKRDAKRLMGVPDCVIVDATWYMDHFFLWEEDVSFKWRLSDLADNNAIKKEFMKKSVNKKNKKEEWYLPSISSGRFLKTLIDKNYLIPMTEGERYRMGVHKGDPETPEEWIDFFMKNPSEVSRCCHIDTVHDLQKKLGSDPYQVKYHVSRNRIFCGDTESFIDPDTGAHKTSLLVIKGYNEDSPVPRTVKALWEVKDPVVAGMREFLKTWAEARTKVMMEVIDEAHKNSLDQAEKAEKDDPEKYEGHLEKVKNLWEKRRKNIDGILEKYGTKYEGFKQVMKMPGLNVAKYKDVKEQWKPPIIYFHHLGYDIQPFLCRFLPDHAKNPIMKGAVYYSVTFRFMGEVFELRNSLTLITMGIAKFPKAFLPKEEQAKMIKEVYAYEAINEHLMEFKINSRPGFWVTLDTLHDAIKAFEKRKSEEEQEKLYEDLVKTASRPEVDCIDGDLFDVGKYTIYYCERDVDLLKVGLHAWEGMGLQDTSKSTYKGTPPFRKFDVFGFLSAPAIAQTLVEVEVRAGTHYGWENKAKQAQEECKKGFQKLCTYKYSGRLRKFMLLGTTGGRCNLPWEKAVQVDCLRNPDVKELYDKVVRGEKLTDEERQYMFDHTIQDFDARSLYPTAMSRSFIPLGIPKFFKCPPGTTEELLKKKHLPDDAFYVIKNVRYDKKLAMPCNCWKQEKPEPRCRWTNEVPPEAQLVRKQTDLLTMMEVQGAHFEIIGGCKWKRGKCTKIQEMMKKLYEFRRLNHSGGFDHPIQEIAKLLMNSYYGKNVTKMREYEERLYPLHPWMKQHDGSFKQVNGFGVIQNFIKNNFRKIVGFRLLGGIMSLKLRTDDEGKYDACFGCEVLAGSRALICRVSAAIEDITKNPPLYTDTDSLHVFGWQIGAISEWFQNKFGIPMIGGELGQFHPDFEPQGFKPGEKFLGSVFFCGVGKKMYIDEVFGDQGSTYFHKRAKGIRAEWLSKREYQQLYEGKILVKDCDECGGVNIRPKNGVNYSVHLIKKVRKTAYGEVEVQDELTTVDDRPLVQNSDGELEDLPSEPEVEERTSTPPLAEAEVTKTSSCTVSDDYLLANKRARENNPPEEDNDTIEIIYDPESDEEQDEPLDILDEPVQKKVADEVQKNVQRWLRDFNARDKAMMYETLERFLAGGNMGEDDWFYLGRLNANNDDQVYARESMRQLQQDLPQFQDELNKLK